MPEIPNISVYMYYGGTAAGLISIIIDTTHMFEMDLADAKNPDTRYHDLSMSIQDEPVNIEYAEKLYRA